MTQTTAPAPSHAPEGERREIKFVLPHVGGRDTAGVVASRAPRLREAHPSRRVSSVYFDSSSYALFHQSNSGASRRMKLRVRWYRDLHTAERPVIEFKHRLNDYGWKTQHEIGSFDLATTTWDDVRAAMSDRVTGAHRAHVAALHRPILIATYDRRYLATDDGRIRVTIDTDIRFFDQRLHARPNTSTNWVAAPFAILECKVDRLADRRATHILDALGLRWVRFSKYCHGVTALSRH